MKKTIIKAPFKIGDTVYFLLHDTVYDTYDILENTVTDVSNEFFRISGDDWEDKTTGKIMHHWRPYSDIGNVVFLSKNEAENEIPEGANGQY